MFEWLPGGWLSGVVALSVAAFYCFATWTFDYWRKRNVPYARPLWPLFGNLAVLAAGMEHQWQTFDRIYRGFRDRQQRYGGLFQMRTPFLMVCDPELINRMLIKDFGHFTDHGLYVSGPDQNPLGNGLFTMRGTQWRVMRAKLSPVFTSGKLKLMHGQISECSEQLMRALDAELTGGGASSDRVLEVRDELGKYSTDVIGTVAFGLQLDAMRDGESSAFRKHGKAIFRPSPLVLFRDLAWMISPAFRRALHIGDLPREAIEFFTQAFTETMRYRQRNAVVRNDVMQSLIQAREDLVINKTEPSVQFEETDIVANAFVMFVAGFETVSTAMSFCLYELALNKQIQDRVRNEMIAMKSQHGEINHEFLNDLRYLEMVLCESLRMYPPLVMLFRECTQDYQLPDSTLVIEKGTKVMIPVFSLHRDPKYFPDPQKFDPERFTPEEKAKRTNGTYLPFGDGPRLCIGKRFAEMEMKLALTEILTKYEVEPCEKTSIPMTFSKRSLIVAPEHGVWLKFKPIKESSALQT